MMEDLDDLTNAAIAELEASPEIVNMRMVIEGQFENWTQKLFPLLQGQKRPCYAFVVALLHRAGHTVATEELVRKYISRIRARRGVVIPRAVKPVQQPVGVTLTFPEREVAPARAVTLTPVPRGGRQAVQVPVAVPVAPALPAVVPVPISDWVEELTRLEQEGKKPWTGADEWMWSYLCEKAAAVGSTLPKDFFNVEKVLKDPMQVEVLGLLVPKYKRERLPLLK